MRNANGCVFSLSRACFERVTLQRNRGLPEFTPSILLSILSIVFIDEVI